jgi:choline dehydrogenase-like flavoprotein
MPIIPASAMQPSYDVVIVGSGAAGGQMAYTLTMAGAKVLMLEAGRVFDPVAETAMFQVPSQAPLRAAPTPDKQYGFYDSSLNSGWTMPDEPYTNADDGPKRQFHLWRQRMLGGRTNHWGRIALRNGPYDFKPRTHLGVGFDWPISYEEVAPYYDRVELLIGVFGGNEALENVPASSPGVLLPPPKFRASELLVQQRGRRLGMTAISCHRAVLSVQQDARTVPAKLHPNNPRAQRLLAESMQQRAACFWATDCHRGCAIKANYQSTTVHLPPALATGNLDILPNAMAREVEVDDRGRATGVIFIDKLTRQEHRAKGRAVVLAAGSQDSVRLLLNSRSPRFPDGVGNSSGKVGRYITDSVSSRFSGQIPILEDLPIHNEDGAVGPQAHIPFWLYREQREGRLDFPGNYQIFFGGGRQMPTLDTGTNLDWLSGRSGYAYGHRLKEDARRYYGSMLGVSAQGSMVPNEHCYAELDPVVRDKWGIPVLRFHWQFSDYELRQVEHQQRTLGALIEALGGRMARQPEKDALEAIAYGGQTIHEVGGAIMGATAATSVTNAWNQTWDCPNLVVADGAVFASTASKNSTLTILALAWRAADHLLEEMQRGNL